MDFNELKDINKVKALSLSVVDDVKKEIDKLKDVNKERFIEGFNKCFVSYLQNEYIKFDGRVSRCKYWMFALYSMLIGVAISMIITILPFLGILSKIYLLAILVPSVGLGVRRLHDINFSGWWFLISLIPYVGAIALIFLFALPGDKKANSFGDK